VYIKKYNLGDLVEYNYNPKNRGLAVIISGPDVKYAIYEILTIKGETTWISHTCIQDV